MRQSLVAGNWKLNGTRSSVVELAKSVSRGVASLSTEVLICPTFVHLSDVHKVVGSAVVSASVAGTGVDSSGVAGDNAVRLGAQNCSVAEDGAFTGEVSAAMLAEFGCRYVIVGHSERRQLFGENNELVAAKFQAVQSQGLTPILCVGETLSEREADRTNDVIAEQLEAVLNCDVIDGAGEGSPGGVGVLANAVIAYEPVWAIGTGKSATAQQAQDVHQWLRQRIASADQQVADGVRILYGGSVKSGNAAELFAQNDIDGGLIGGAALSADDFIAICAAA